MIGSIKLSNCAANTKYTNINANRNAKVVFDELSEKSRDGPLKSVVNDSSKTFSLIASIAFIPSPIVFPGAKPAVTVADLYLL